MNNRKFCDLAGFAGSIMLILAVFAPVMDKPFDGSISFLSQWSFAGIIIILCAISAGLLSFFSKVRFLWVPAAVSILIISIKLYDMNHDLDQFSLGNSFFRASIKAVYAPQWGWYFLFGAAVILLAVSAYSFIKKQ